MKFSVMIPSLFFGLMSFANAAPGDYPMIYAESSELSLVRCDADDTCLYRMDLDMKSPLDFSLSVLDMDIDLTGVDSDQWENAAVSTHAKIVSPSKMGGFGRDPSGNPIRKRVPVFVKLDAEYDPSFAPDQEWRVLIRVTDSKGLINTRFIYVRPLF